MASTGEAWRLGRRPALDGLRGMAVLLVIAAHVQVPGFGGGGIVGVTMFFTLSGFLITSLLLEERARSGRVSLRGFYLRRARRLLPALVVLVVCVVAVGLSSWGSVAVVGLYVGNWIRAAGGALGFLGHTWSLAIEEQFYVLWPLLLIGLRGRRRPLAVVAGLGVVGSVTARALLWDGGTGLDRVYFGTDTRADAVLLGCLLAIYLHGEPARTLPAWVATAGLSGACVFSVFATGASAYVVAPLAAAVLTVAALFSVVQGGAPGWLSAGWLRYAGRRSYGLYLWHVPLVWLVDDQGFAARAVAVAVAVVVAELSWRLVERPAQRLRRPDLRPHHQGRSGDREDVPRGGVRRVDLQAQSDVAS